MQMCMFLYSNHILDSVKLFRGSGFKGFIRHHGQNRIETIIKLHINKGEHNNKK